MTKWQYRVTWLVGYLDFGVQKTETGPWIDLEGRSGMKLEGYQVVEFREVKVEDEPSTALR